SAAGYYLSSHAGGSNRVKFGHRANGSLIYDNNDPDFATGNFIDQANLVAFNISQDNQIEGWRNGQAGSTLTSLSSSGADRASIGQEFDGSGGDNETSDHWAGELAEMIIVDRELSTLERHKVESYLALKYGIHLDHNYYAADWDGSAGTTLWNVGTGFDNHITGMGRDDRSGLDQRQSTGAEGPLSIYHGNFYNGQFPTINALNPNSFVLDRSYILWGDNAGSTASLNASIYSGANTAINRIWRVAKTGVSDLLTIRIPKAFLPATTTALYINRNGDSSFPNSPQTLIYNLLDDGTHWYSLAELEDGDLLTFGDGTGVTFPVEWLDLQAVQTGEDIQLQWGTTQELNSDFFAVERSLDGRTFDEIGQINSAGTTSIEQAYQYDDLRAIYLPAEQLYYRVRQVDLDGSLSYSNTVAIQADRAEIALNLFLAPNPADQMVSILVQSGSEQAIQLSVMNSLGQEVYREQMLQGRKQLDLQSWSAGIYYVRVENDFASTIKKLVIR
ncbi:MAG: T9SS type A sorting domain-containing protein, partial [Bacteroidota bacterium]